MFVPTKHAENNPTHILVRDKKGSPVKWAAIGVIPAEGNQKAYKYAYEIGLTKWVEKKPKE